MNLVKIWVVLGIFIGLTPNNILSQNKAEKPNIVLIMADDLTWHDIEPYGSNVVKTPNLARLADEGLSFDNMFTATAMCAPTRQQILTGLFPVRNGAFPNHGKVYKGTKSIFHYLQDLGYETGLIGKKHIGPDSSFPFKNIGGQNHDGGEGMDIDLSKAEKFINDSGDNPYLLVVTSNQPHGPLNRGDRSAYPPEDINVPPYLVDTKMTRENLSAYYAEITYLDSLVGRTLDIIDDSKEQENTIVIFTSEQGSGMPFGKWTNYDNGLKTAFIVRWPGKIEKDTRTAAMAQYVDVVPTILDIVGENPDDIDTGTPDAYGNRGFDGRSFRKVLEGKTGDFRDYVFGVHTTRGIIKGSDSYPIRSVRSDKYLYIHNLNSEGKFSNVVTNGKLLEDWKNTGREEDHKRAEFYEKRPAEELYDVRKDPYQLNNIIDEPGYEEVVKTLKSELAQFMKQQGDKGIETELQAHDRKKAK